VIGRTYGQLGTSYRAPGEMARPLAPVHALRPRVAGGDEPDGAVAGQGPRQPQHRGAEPRAVGSFLVRPYIYDSLVVPHTK
jgi:hypothetical protein